MEVWGEATEWWSCSESWNKRRRCSSGGLDRRSMSRRRDRARRWQGPLRFRGRDGLCCWRGHCCDRCFAAYHVTIPGRRGGVRRLGQEDRDAGLPLPASESRSACVRAGIVVGPLFRFNCSCLAECVDEGLRHVRTSCSGCLGRYLDALGLQHGT